MGLFKVRRTTTPGLIPAGLTYGEMAINLADRILYVGNGQGEAVDIAGGGVNRFFYQSEAPGLSQGFGLSGETGQYDYLIGSRWLDSDDLVEYIFIGQDDEWAWVQPAGGGGGASNKWVNPLPTTATDIEGIPAGTLGLTGQTPIQILERILYPYQNVTLGWSNVSLPSQLELGQTAGNGSATIQWTSSGPEENWISNSAYVRYFGSFGSGIPSGTLIEGGSPTAGSAEISYPPFRGIVMGSSLQLTLTGHQVGGVNTIVTATPQTTAWYPRVYWGKSASENEENALALFSGSSELFVFPSTRTITISEGAGYFYLFLHNNYRLVSIFNGPTLLALQRPLPTQPPPVLFTNQHGVQQQYKIYRSNEILNGSLDITFTTTTA